ncbi:hypothetical protein I600_1249 [Maribacter dokdonensis DSW-8]|nr:hypothetical protein I600_1249 [Maribacter dokdonensis DSW-8]
MIPLYQTNYSRDKHETKCPKKQNPPLINQGWEKNCYEKEN